jgi:predicted regulator of Ras-like GTPase activity (Roadblock/LC7/MglB family)
MNRPSMNRPTMNRSSTTPPTVNVPPTRLADILSSLLAIPGVLGASFIDPQGQSVAHAGDPGVTEVLSAYESVWLGELGRAGERAGLGALGDVALDFERKRVVTAAVKDGYFVLVVLDPGGLGSVVRARLEEARERMASEIG